MALSNTNTRTTGASYIPRILSDYILEIREKNLQAANFVTRRDMDLKGRGQSVDFPVAQELSAYSYADGDKLEDNLSVTTDSVKTITVSQVPMRPFLILDTLNVQSQADLKAQELKLAGYAVAKSIDTGILAEIVDFSVNSIQNETTPTTALALTNLIAAKYTLDNNDVPETERVWFFDPIVEKDMLGLTGNYFSSYDFSGSKGLVKGQLTSPVLGSPVVMTTNLPTGTSGSPAATYHKNAYFHKSALGVVMQKNVEIQSEYSVNFQGWLMNVRAMYGTTSLRTNHGVLIYR